MSVYVPIVIAIISALTAVAGYMYEKRKEREFQLRETRKNIHQQMIANLMEKSRMSEQVLKDPDAPEPSQENMIEYYNYIEKNHPDLWDNIFKGLEIQAMMSVYGTDETIKATADFYRESISFANKMSPDPPNMPAMILKLRKTLFANTQVTEEDIYFMLAR